MVVVVIFVTVRVIVLFYSNSTSFFFYHPQSNRSERRAIFIQLSLSLFLSLFFLLSLPPSFLVLPNSFPSHLFSPSITSLFSLFFLFSLTPSLHLSSPSITSLFSLFSLPPSLYLTPTTHSSLTHVSPHPFLTHHLYPNTEWWGCHIFGRLACQASARGEHHLLVG